MSEEEEILKEQQAIVGRMCTVEILAAILAELRAFRHLREQQSPHEVVPDAPAV
jgi:hypothetical protein